MRLGDGQPEAAACPSCGAKWDCLCKCRERIRLTAAEYEAMDGVVYVARLAAMGPVSDETRLHLLRALAIYDAATAARESAP